MCNYMFDWAGKVGWDAAVGGSRATGIEPRARVALLHELKKNISQAKRLRLANKDDILSIDSQTV